MKLLALTVGLFLTASVLFAIRAADGNNVIRMPVIFSGGYDTDPRDHGRPVNLVAGALGVPPEVFREAFSHVHPAGPDSGGPTREEARANKAALMAVLGPYGITNDRLDKVSNRYRYVKSHGEMWPTKAAVANALVVNGVITGYEIVSGGFGYTTPPTASVPKAKGEAPKIEISFGNDFEKNGSVSAITIAPGKDK
ncbi:MAG TPA: hypothetical protein VGM54_07575 [Chthoniobacter sp.]|jgi:hypothetical protein